MIVTCERCATQFQLDDSRVPREGVRVRCSRCKYAFEVHPPRPAGAEPTSEEEESDWQFNQDPPAGSPDAGFDGRGAGGDRNGASGSGPAPSDADEDLSADASPSGLDLAGGPLGGDADWDAPAAASLDDAEPDSLFEKPAPPPEMAEPPPAPTGRSRFEAPPEEPVETREEPSSELDALVRESRDSGSGLDLQRRAAAPGDDDELASPSGWEGDASAGGADFGAPPPRRFAVDPDELIDERPRWQGWIGHAGGAVGWSLVLMLFGLGLYGGLWPRPAPDPAPIAVSEGLEVADVSGRWIEHLEAGPIYVVHGRLVNNGGNGRAAPELAVELLDASGQPVTSKVPLTLPNRPEDLREASIAALTGAGGLQVRPVGIRAGEQREVEAVIGRLPPHARRIRVVAADATTTAARAPEQAPRARATGAPVDPGPAAPEDQPGEVAPPAAPAP